MRTNSPLTLLFAFVSGLLGESNWMRWNCRFGVAASAGMATATVPRTAAPAAAATEIRRRRFMAVRLNATLRDTPPANGHDRAAVRLLDRDDELARVAARRQVADRPGRLGQRIAAADHRRDLARLEQRAQLRELLGAHPGGHAAQALAHEG